MGKSGLVSMEGDITRLISCHRALFQLVGKKGSMRKFADCLNKAAEAVKPLLLVRG